MRHAGPGEMTGMCPQAAPSAAGTEGYATGLLGSSATQVEESGLKGGTGPLPNVHGSAGANEQDYNALDHKGRTPNG